MPGGSSALNPGAPAQAKLNVAHDELDESEAARKKAVAAAQAAQKQADDLKMQARPFRV